MMAEQRNPLKRVSLLNSKNILVIKIYNYFAFLIL